MQQIIKAFGNVEQAQELLLEQILIQSCTHNLPQIFNSMAMEYSQLCSVYKRPDNLRSHRIKRVRTEEKPQHKKDDSDDLISLLMFATQNNLIKMHQGTVSREMNTVQNYQVEVKPMFRIVRAFQWANEGEQNLMLTNVNSLVKNFPEALRHIDVTNSMYQVIQKLSKRDSNLKKQLDLV